MADLDALPREELESLAEAAREVLTCQRVLAKTGDTVVGEILRGAGPFYEWRRYPAGDVYDPEFHAQYYYHAHPEEERLDGEHGHFHVFMRPRGMPAGVRPAPLPDLKPPEDDNADLSHIVGISMDRAGGPFRLFTTNRWVTGETWYEAEDVVRMLDGFVVDHARPSWPVNRWITGLVRLFRPQIVELLHARDAAVARLGGDCPHDDRSLEIASEARISVEAQVAEVEAALRRTRRRAGALRRVV